MRDNVKRLTSIVILLAASLVAARDEELPFTFGGLDWSSDGRYIAVGTTRGVYIHNSEDLSLHKVLDDVDVRSVVWSNSGLKLVFNDDVQQRITIHDFESGERKYLYYPTLPHPSRASYETFSVRSMDWSPSDRHVAAGGFAYISVWEVEWEIIATEINVLRQLFAAVDTQIDWRPDDGRFILSGISNGLGIWKFDREQLYDFIWNVDSKNSPARWSPAGDMIAAGSNPVIIWKVTATRTDTGWIETMTERMLALDFELGRLYGMSWHPDGSKLAFMFVHHDSTPMDVSKDGALIWDILSNSTTLLPGVFLRDMEVSYQTIEWSPDGSRLAAISSDGRIVIWNTDTYDVVAEYAGYRSILDFYVESDMFQENR